ncbi:MAG: polysaccharide biosynthesis C-terminal domain-containing protein, partial [Bacteroidota bacterium]
VTAEEVGNYALAVKVGLGAGLVTTAVQMAFNPFSMAVRAHREASAFYAEAFLYTMFVLGSMVMLIVANLAPLVRLLGGSAYEGAVVPAAILLAGQCFLSAFTFLATGSNIRKKTVYHLYAQCVALACCVGLCALLVPRFGPPGAAGAVACACAALALTAGLLSQRVHPIPYPWGRALRGAGVMLAVVLALTLWRGESWGGSGTANLAACAGVFLLSRMMLRAEERQRLLGFLRTALQGRGG